VAIPWAEEGVLNGEAQACVSLGVGCAPSVSADAFYYRLPTFVVVAMNR